MNVQAVAQPQVQEIPMRERAVVIALRLVAKLCNPFVDKMLIEFVVAIHGIRELSAWARTLPR